MKWTADIPSLSTTKANFSTGEATVPKNFDKTNNGTLVDIIRYYYNVKPKGLTDFNKTKLVEDVMKLNAPTGPWFILFYG